MKSAETTLKTIVADQAVALVEAADDNRRLRAALELADQVRDEMEDEINELEAKVKADAAEREASKEIIATLTAEKDKLVAELAGLQIAEEAPASKERAVPRLVEEVLGTLIGAGVPALVVARGSAAQDEEDKHACCGVKLVSELYNTLMRTIDKSPQYTQIILIREFEKIANEALQYIKEHAK